MTKHFLMPGAMLLVLTLVLSPTVVAQAPENTAPSAGSPQSPSANPPTTTLQDRSNVPSASQAPAQATDDNPLGLTEDQKAQLRPIVMEENKQMEAVRNDASLSDEQKIAKTNEIRETASPKIKSVLTPEQLQKLVEMQRARQQQEKQSAPSDSQQPPR